ncbi:hypothetical protein [Oceanicola sp. S124]|uniref:hypothetical protein n=1 Tax=Oceanicola sp. S124 TaxID=1042378 RepID=UPI00110F7DDB|nr:hypothetical protein [Oceanicola sp. S124]MBR9822507.1 hypothetical protein [Paracoccaceae bacterium]
MTKRFNPASEAVAFRLWQHCQGNGWDCTIAEAAVAIDEPVRRVCRIAGHKGWGHRFRATRRDASAAFEAEAAH